MIDYFSRYIEVACLHDGSKAECVNTHIKSIFARHGIPQILISDNGPPFNSFLFVDFARTYGFQHITSSPHFPRSNGDAEGGAQTMKRLLKSNSDLYCIAELPVHSVEKWV